MLTSEGASLSVLKAEPEGRSVLRGAKRRAIRSIRSYTPFLAARER